MTINNLSIQPSKQINVELSRAVVGVDPSGQFTGQEKTSLLANVANLQTGLANIAAPNLAPINSRIANVEQAVANIAVPNISPLASRIANVESELAGIAVPNLIPLSNRIANVESELAGITASNSSPLASRVTTVENTLVSVQSKNTQQDSVISSLQSAIAQLETGNPATLPLATDTNAGLMAPAQVTKLAGIAAGATVNATDAQLRDRATHTGTQPISTIAGLQTALDGKATLISGKLDPSQVPDIALQQYLGAVANEAAMLALAGQLGDWCTRSDTGTDWRIVGNPATIAGWLQTAYPSAPVVSVAGRTGAVTLAKGDVGLGNVDNTSDVNKPVSTAQATAIGAKMDATLPALQVVVDSGTPAQRAAFSASVSVDPADERARIGVRPLGLFPTHIRQPFSNFAPISNMASNATYAQMLMIPAKYSAIQIGVIHCGQIGVTTSGTMTGRKLAVAATDDIGTLGYTTVTTDKHFITPRRSGAEVNTYSAGGWQAVTFGGAATCPDIPDPGLERIAVVWSDIIPCHAVPLASDPTNRFAGYFPLLVRDYPGTGFVARCPQAGFIDPARYVADAGPALVLGANRGGGDFVTTLANWHVGSTPSYSESAVTALVIVAYTSDRRPTVMMIGDSRFATASTAEATTAYRNTVWRTENALRAAGIRASIWSAAHGGKTTEQYSNRAAALLAAGEQVPDASVYLVCSINDGSPTQTVINACKVRALLHKRRCAQLGIRPHWLSIFPSTGGYGSNMPAVQELEQWVASLGDPYLSPLALYGNPSTGDWVGDWNEDSNHMTPAGYTDLSNRIAALLAPNI